MKRIALIGPPWRVPSPAFKSISQLIYAASNNTGNMAFSYAISEQLGVMDKPLGWGGNNPAEIREKYDVIVMMAANQIQSPSDNAKPIAVLNQFLEKCQLPIVVIGLGSQAEYGASRIELDENSRRLLDILRDRSAHVSIRGAFTAEILEAHGITDYVLTGCPSNFINKSRNLGEELEKKFRGLRDIERLAVNCDVRPGLRDIVPPLVRWLEEREGAWISQIYEEIAFLRRQSDENHMKTLRSWGRIMKPNSDLSFVADFLTKYCQYFLDVEQWMDFLVRFDLAVGTRLHGNMLAWQAGTPAVWIPHDARTAELAKLMALPHMDREQLRENMTLGEFMEKCAFDGVAYDSRRAELMKRYCDFLDKAGLQLSKQYAWMKSP